MPVVAGKREKVEKKDKSQEEAEACLFVATFLTCFLVNVPTPNLDGLLQMV